MVCPYAHFDEKAKRRDPRKYEYLPIPCPDYRRGTCKRGDACNYAHGVFECWLHPHCYKSRLCKFGKECTRSVCFFAHEESEIRPIPDDIAAEINKDTHKKSISNSSPTKNNSDTKTSSSIKHNLSETTTNIIHNDKSNVKIGTSNTYNNTTNKIGTTSTTKNKNIPNNIIITSIDVEKNPSGNGEVRKDYNDVSISAVSSEGICSMEVPVLAPSSSYSSIQEQQNEENTCVRSPILSTSATDTPTGCFTPKSQFSCESSISQINDNNMNSIFYDSSYIFPSTNYNNTTNNKYNSNFNSNSNFNFNSTTNNSKNTVKIGVVDVKMVEDIEIEKNSNSSNREAVRISSSSSEGDDGMMLSGRKDSVGYGLTKIMEMSSMGWFSWTAAKTSIWSIKLTEDSEEATPVSALDYASEERQSKNKSLNFPVRPLLRHHHHHSYKFINTHI